MPRRIEIELTSSRDDGTWTWRAAGAKEPRGTLATTILPGGSKVGDVLRVDAEFFVDGIEITGVVPVKGGRKEPDRLELITPAGKDDPLVTTTLAERGRDDRSRRDGGRREGSRRDGPGREGPRRDGPRREGARRDGERGDGRGPRGTTTASPRGERGDGDRPKRSQGSERPRRTRPEPPPMPVVDRPKAKRLRAGKVHRNALLESLPEEQRPIAEQVVLGGLPAVRQAIEKQNAERTAAGEAAISPVPLIEMAEKLVPKVRAAEWRDRAEAAQRDLDHLDLRDLRSVVSTADAAAKDEQSRALAQQLKDGLATRVDAEHAAWLAELTATIDVGRIVRALRISSRPPKAGSPLPPELAARLTAGASEALTSDAAPERWVAVLDALAFAPVRDKVIPASLPNDLHADVQATIARLATRIPKIAHIFEISLDRSAPRPKLERRRPPKPKTSAPKTDRAKPDAAKTDAVKADSAKAGLAKAGSAKAGSAKTDASKTAETEPDQTDAAEATAPEPDAATPRPETSVNAAPEASVDTAPAPVAEELTAVAAEPAPEPPAVEDAASERSADEPADPAAVAAPAPEPEPSADATAGSVTDESGGLGADAAPDRSGDEPAAVESGVSTPEG